MFSYSRRQCSISLSSCEAELTAATSVIAESLFLKNILESLSEHPVDLVVRLDNSAARSLLVKCGVSRIRHLDCRLLWCQGLVKAKLLSVKPVAGLQNPADVATKVLSSERIKYLLGLAGMYNNDGLIQSSKPPNVKVQRVASTMDIENLVRSVVYAAIALSQQRPADATSTSLVGAAEMSPEGGEEFPELVGMLWNLLVYRVMEGLMVTDAADGTSLWWLVGGATFLFLFMFLLGVMLYYLPSLCCRRMTTQSSERMTTQSSDRMTTQSSDRMTMQSPDRMTTQSSDRMTPQSSSSLPPQSMSSHQKQKGVWKNRGERDAQARAERAHFVRSVSHNPHIFDPETRQEVAVFSQNGECYHNRPSCHGLRQATSSCQRVPLHDALARGLAPCRVCCASHWDVFNDWLVMPMPEFHDTSDVTSDESVHT